MFTGIVESTGQVLSIHHYQSNVTFEIASPLAKELKIDQSISHNGVCLTVTDLTPNTHFVTAIYETLQKTNLGTWKIGEAVNLERCMSANGRFDGHIVQGHIDQIGKCIEVKDEQGSWRYTFEYEASQGNFTVEKGSICVNGVSLTVVDSQEGRFSVAIIPYTYEHTNFQFLRPNDIVNLEFDVLGKYMKRIFDLHYKK